MNQSGSSESFEVFVSLKKLAYKFSGKFFMSSNRGDEVILDASWGAFWGGVGRIDPGCGAKVLGGKRATSRSF